MAVVFISPKQRQKMFFLIITGAVLLFLVFVALAVLLSQPNEAVQKISFNKVKVNIDMGVFSKEAFKNLQPLPELQKQFSYSAIGKNRKTQNGFISAGSEEEVQEILKDMGWTAINIKEIKPGRENPFVSY